MATRYRRYRQRATDHRLVFRLCIAVLALAIAAIVYMTINGAFGKLWLVTWANMPIWVILALVAGWGFFWCISHKEMNWVELLIYLAFCIPMTIPTVMMGYWFTTGLHAVERINGYVHGGEYYEEYTTETESMPDEDGNTTKTETYHAPEWYILSSVTLYGHRQKVSCSRSDYKHYVKKFGNEDFHALSHIDQISIGDGNMYSTSWDGSIETKTPMVSNHPYVNYIKASERVKQMQASISGFEDFLQEYPEIHDGPNGPIELDRVLTSGVNVPGAWTQGVDSALDHELMELGSERQCNILVYIAGTGNRRFRYALDGHWNANQKNDIVVVVGVTQYPKIDFVEVSCLATDKLFEIELRDRLEDLGTISGSPEAFASIITTQIRKPIGEGGYERDAMENQQHLIYEIDLPWWATLLLIVFTIGSTSPFMYFFLNNEFSDKNSKLTD